MAYSLSGLEDVSVYLMIPDLVLRLTSSHVKMDIKIKLCRV